MQYVCIKIQPRPPKKTLDNSGSSIDSQPSNEEWRSLPPSSDPTDNSSVEKSPKPASVDPEIKSESFREDKSKSNFIQLEHDTLILWYHLALSNYTPPEKQFLLNCLHHLGKMPSLNDVQQSKKLPTDYSKLASTVGTFNQPKISPQTSAALPAPSTGGYENTLKG